MTSKVSGRSNLKKVLESTSWTQLVPGSLFQVRSAQLRFTSPHYRRIRPGSELRLLSAASLQVFSLLTGTLQVCSAQLHFKFSHYRRVRPGPSSLLITDEYGAAPTGKTRPGRGGPGRVLPYRAAPGFTYNPRFVVIKKERNIT